MIEIEILRERFILLPEKVIWWKERKILVIADLHLGKINHFRKSGIPVPPQANDRNTETLISIIQATKPTRVIFLGDLFHSHYNEEWEVLGQIRKHFTACSFELVQGNHDILSDQQYIRHQIQVHKVFQEGNLILTHEPMEVVPEECYNLAGHLHPGVQLRGRGRQYMILPCYWFGTMQGILPAFGAFTGLAKIKPAKDDRIFILADNQVMALPT